MLHLKNKLSGYKFCETRRPNIYSPNVSIIRAYPYKEKCEICNRYFEKFKDIK